MPWDTSCPDWEDRILAGRSLIPSLPLNRDQAEKGLRIFKRFKVPDMMKIKTESGAMDFPRLGDVCGQWFIDIVEVVFGCYDPINQFRHIQEFFVMVPKGNAKTSYSAPLFLTAVIMNERPEAEFHFVAPTKNIATYAFDQTANTIRADQSLLDLLHIQNHLKLITHRRTGATMQVKAADTDVITGGKQVATLIDETHVFAKKAGAKDIFVEIRGALGKRPDGFLFQTTTQSKDEPAGVFKSELIKARNVRDGKTTGPILPVLYELPARLIKEKQWRNEDTWPLVNPNFGKSVRQDFLRRTLQEADEQGAAQVALVASQHWNVEIGIGLGADRWEGADYWLETAEPALTLEYILENSEVCTIGIDGGGLDDLLGFCVMGREKVTRRWIFWNKAWCHKGVLKLRKEIAPRLQDFADLGQLVIVDEVGQDVIELCDIIERVRDANLLPEQHAIGVDPVGISDIIDELERREFSADQEKGQIDGIPQGWTLTNIIKTLARRVSSGDAAHSGLEMMAWVIGNVKTEMRGNAVTVTKQVSGKAKIDPFMATLNAGQLMSKNPVVEHSYLEEDEVLVL